MTRCLAGATLTVAAYAFAAPPAPARELGAGAAATYDDHLLESPERDLFTFQYRLNPPRFAVETTDDLVLAEYVAATWEPSRSTSVLGRFAMSNYVKNRIRNYVEWMLQGRMRVAPRWHVTLRGSYLPSYYKRQYVEDEVAVPYPLLPRYQVGKYQQVEGEASVEWRLGGWRNQLGYEYGRRDYLGAFPERDENRHAVKLSIRTPRRAGLVARVAGVYRAALARGRDGDEGGGPPDDPDPSTRTLGAGLTVEWTPRIPRPPLVLRQTVYYEDRRYTTTDATDTQRFGRAIHETDLDWAITVGLSRQLGITAGYSVVLENLTGDRSKIETFTDAGSYHRHLVSLSLDWATRRGRTPREGE